jgi:putative nucleotidyltransferase with HDIG domain
VSRIQEVLDGVSNLPATPVVFNRLMEVLKDPLVEASRLVRIIEMDEAMAANVLRVCNSARFHGLSRVRNVAEGVARLGNKNILQIAMTTSSRRLLSKPQDGYGMAPDALWRHGVGVGLACRRLAAKIGIADTTAAFTAGLLHDVGKLVLSGFVSEEASRIRKLVLEEGADFITAEREVLGIDHAAVGGALAERWSFPPDLIQVIRWHHAPQEAGDERRLASVVNLADGICHLSGAGVGLETLARPLDEELLEELTLTAYDVEEGMILLRDDLDGSRETLGLLAAS